MRIRRDGWLHRLLRDLKGQVLDKDAQCRMLEVAIDNAYEGLLITDANGLIIKANQVYATFLGKTLSEMIGRHVTEVVENTRMHIVAQTGKPEIAQIQKINGHEMICHRIPIFDQEKVVAVVGKVMFQDVDDLFAMIDRFKRLKKELEFYKNELNKRLGAKYSFANIFGVSQELERVKDLGRKVAKSDTTVLLQGESGTGKELFAHAIHVESNRALEPFVKVNCAAIPENLFESELFGYKEGAFTGAQKKGKRGKFALADKGTLFLDEVSELPLQMQVKLLRVLQEREIEPIGAEQPEQVNVRIIAASNKNLEALVEQGLFRHDLFYRLNVVQLHIPALRERKTDIPLLTEKILKQLEKETGIPVEGVDSETEAVFTAYSWPGNVRELRNVLEQTLYIKTGTIITRQDIPRAMVTSAEGNGLPGQHRTLKFQLGEMEEELIRNAIREEKGDKLAAAARLGISKSSLYAKIELYEIK
ncbi:MAG: AAA family ATPase [Geobacter sp.]|nr:MAG: AAA family ATPase [Geobacter sp.]